MTTIHLYQNAERVLPFHIASRQWARTDHAPNEERDMPTREDFWVVEIPEDERGDNPDAFRLEMRSNGKVRTIRTDNTFAVLVMAGHLIVLGATSSDVFCATMESAVELNDCRGCQQEAMQETVDAATNIAQNHLELIKSDAQAVARQAGMVVMPASMAEALGMGVPERQRSGGGPVTPPSNMPA